jgi:hypothetical protein
MRTLESRAMAGAFDILRANDLIFSYVVSNWLMDLDQQAFDILAWKADSTRLPAAMHSFCLRCLYLRDELALGEMELAGQQLSLSDVKSDALRGGRNQRPHCALACVIKGHQAARRQGSVRPIPRWPYRRHRQPARPEALVRDSRPSCRRRRSGALAPPGRAAPGGRTGPHGRRRGPVVASSRPPWAAASTRRPRTRPVNTYAADSGRGGAAALLDKSIICLL